MRCLAGRYSPVVSASTPIPSDAEAHPVDELPVKQPLGLTAIRGAKLATGAAIFSRGFSLVSQIVLGILLMPQDFKLWALVLASMTFFSVLRESSVHRVLLARKDEFDRLARPALYLVVTGNLVAIFLVAVTSPLMASAFEEPRLRNLLWLMCLSMFVGIGNSIYAIKAAIDLKFGVCASVNVLASLARSVLMIAVALIWKSPVCFVAGYVASHAVEAIGYRYVTGTLPRVAEPIFARMWEIARDCGWIIVGVVATSLIVQGDYIVIGWMTADDEVLLGYYSFGFQLSVSFAMMLMGSLANVLSPTFSHLVNDQPRLISGVQRSVRMLTVFASLTNGMLAVAAPAGIMLLWGVKWQPAIFVVQVLSFASITRSISIIGTSLLEARGHWGIRTAILTFEAGGTVLAAYIGCKIGGLVAIAGSVALYQLCSSVLLTTVSFRTMKIPPMVYYQASVAPFLICVGSSLAVIGLDYAYLDQLLPIVRLPVAVSLFLLLSGLLLRLVMPERFAEFMQILIHRRKKAQPAEVRNSEGSDE